MTSYAEQFRKRDAGGDHWYVMVVGVDPAKSGRGLGSRLLARMFEEAERDKTPCYLETAQPRNVPFYKKNGFDLLLEDVDPVNKVRFWTFRRDPGTGRRKD
ncbi:MAG: GNAT family N-acetyltransferase [Thaumarchaeota archaeon]|nr:GNAT family N-acetyltransferase [Nitrososphaerota archaeon]